MAWHAYVTSPIDWWEPWNEYDPPEAAPSQPGSQDLFTDKHSEAYLQRHLFEMYSVAKGEFKRLGWEGDGNWYYAGIPAGTSGPDAILAVKQYNNGSVFVLSPVPLNWLE